MTQHIERGDGSTEPVRDPADGPALTGRQLCSYPEDLDAAREPEPGAPSATHQMIRELQARGAAGPAPQVVYEAKLAEVREALEAAGVPAPLARRKAAGIYSDWLSAVLGRHTGESLTQYATRKAGA